MKCFREKENGYGAVCFTNRVDERYEEKKEDRQEVSDACNGVQGFRRCQPHPDRGAPEGRRVQRGQIAGGLEHYAADAVAPHENTV